MNNIKKEEKKLFIKKCFFVLKLIISILLLFYIFKYIILFKDKIILKDNKVLNGNIIKQNNNFIRIKVNNKEYLISKNNIKELKIGFISILKKINILYFFLGTFLIFINSLITSLRLYWLLKTQNFKISFIETVKINFIGLFFNNFLPSFTGGDIVKAYYIAKGSKQVIKSIVCILMDRIIGLGTLVFLTSILLLFYFNFSEFFLPTIIIYSCLLGLIIFILFLLFFPYSYLEKKSKTSLFFKLLKSFCEYRNSKVVLIKAFFLSFFIYIFTNIAVLFYGYSLNLFNIKWFIFFIYVPVGFILMALPISLAGWGIGEISYIILFAKVGINSEYALLLSILLKISQILVSLIGGVIWIFFDNNKLDLYKENKKMT